MVNTDIVIDWLRKIKKKTLKLLPFYIIKFIHKESRFAISIHSMSENNSKIAMGARKALLFHYEKPGKKKWRRTFRRHNEIF